ncbi:MAG TPA: DUF4333 domain-containing protein [Solirubrobacterales bacterium]
MSLLARCFLVVALAAIAFAAAGCGGTVIDSEKTEDTLQANVEHVRHEKIDSVDCPSGEDVDPGATFVCAVNFSDGKKATVTLKIRNKDADVDVVGFKFKQ